MNLGIKFPTFDLGWGGDSPKPHHTSSITMIHFRLPSDSLPPLSGFHTRSDHSLCLLLPSHLFLCFSAWACPVLGPQLPSLLGEHPLCHQILTAAFSCTMCGWLPGSSLSSDLLPQLHSPVLSRQLHSTSNSHQQTTELILARRKLSAQPTSLPHSETENSVLLRSTTSQLSLCFFLVLHTSTRNS